MEAIFGLVIGLEPKTRKKAKYHPATVYYQNKLVTAKRGHRDAAPGKWVIMTITDNKATIHQALNMNFLRTRFFSRTDFKIYTLFTVLDEKTVHSVYCGFATVVSEQRDFVRKERMVYGSARLNSKWQLTFKLSAKPKDNEFNDLLTAPVLPNAKPVDSVERLRSKKLRSKK